MPDASPYTTGSVGLLGTAPSQDALADCDTLIIAGSSFPYLEFYPKPGKAKTVQIDLDPARIGLRHPADIGLVGDCRGVLSALLPRVHQKDDKSFLDQAQKDMKDWNELMKTRGTRADMPMKPQVVTYHLNKLLDNNAIVSSDSGTIATWAARYIEMRDEMQFSLSGTLATMANGLPDEVRSIIAQRLKLSEEEQSEQLPSKAQPRFDNQEHWARFYLSKAGFIDSSKRGVWALTEKGRGAIPLSTSDARSVFREIQSTFAKSKSRKPEQAQVEPIEELSIPPTDGASIEQNYRDEVAQKLQALSPAGFERFCQRLLRESGFQEVSVTGRSGDGGIDGSGILQVNALVSFKVLFQCKRYVGTVAVAQVRDFRGAMMGRADKGIILTTGSFTSEARKEAVRDGVPPIELVDGEKLISMLEQLELGLKPRTTYEVDTTFFDGFI